MEVVDFHDVRVTQGRNYLRFAGEAGDEIGISLQISVEELNGDVALQLGIKGPPDFSHSPPPQNPLQFIFTKASWSRTQVYFTSFQVPIAWLTQ